MAEPYDPKAAAAAIAEWGERHGDDLALRVYSSRLIGRDPALVLHGGGNTSVKCEGRDVTGMPLPVLYVKGSGYDLAAIVPQGFTPLDLRALQRLAGREQMDDTEMVSILEALKLDPRAPFPSVEALLHAFIPGKFVDHTHAVEMLVLTNQPDGRARIEAALGPRFAVLDYVMPGFLLARAGLEAIRGRTDLDGMALRHHGLFTWGATAQESYERMIAAVAACTTAIEQRRRVTVEVAAPVAPPIDTVASLALALRGALSIPRPEHPLRKRFVLSFRSSATLRAQLVDPRLPRLAAHGVLTPDHVIRTKNLPLLFNLAPDENQAARTQRLCAAVAEYAAGYAAYLARHATQQSLVVEDHHPRVVLVPGVGIFCAGASRAEAEIAADITESSLAARLRAADCGEFAGLPERDIFDVEFWPPEQAKLQRRRRPALTGRVALISGAAGAIGTAVAIELARAGAAVVLSDLDPQGTRLARSAARLRKNVPDAALITQSVDLRDPAAIEQALLEVAAAVGGIDLLVMAHGVATPGALDQLESSALRRDFDVNAVGSFQLLGGVVRQMKAQASGGDVVVISTKNVMDPGAEFAAYSASKAAAHQLARVAAIELAPHDIRVNLIAPDAVFGDDEIPSQLWREAGAARARAKGIDPAELPERYRQRNLLKAAVRAEHVASAALFFAERQTPTTGAVLPVDGGLPGAFPR